MSGANELAPGDRFGEYEIIEELGRGAFGSVHKVRRLGLGKVEAIKVLHVLRAADPEIVQRFKREAFKVASIQHPNIVDVRDFKEIDGRHVIVMEYLKGGSLNQMLRERRKLPPEQVRLPLEDALDHLLPVVAAMITVHRRGIVHRDLKPENIFLARDMAGRTVSKVLDFGVARVNDGEDVTQTGQWIGTPSYMSPEQVQSRKDLDGRADQWALAVILFVVLTGEKPFHVPQNNYETLSRIVSAPVPSLRERRPDVPAALEAIVGKALSKRREERYPSMVEFGEALLPFARPAARAEFEALRNAELETPEAAIGGPSAKVDAERPAEQRAVVVLSAQVMAAPMVAPQPVAEVVLAEESPPLAKAAAYAVVGAPGSAESETSEATGLDGPPAAIDAERASAEQAAVMSVPAQVTSVPLAAPSRPIEVALADEAPTQPRSVPAAESEVVIPVEEELPSDVGVVRDRYTDVPKLPSRRRWGVMSAATVLLAGALGVAIWMVRAEGRGSASPASAATSATVTPQLPVAAMPAPEPTRDDGGVDAAAEDANQNLPVVDSGRSGERTVPPRPPHPPPVRPPLPRPTTAGHDAGDVHLSPVDAGRPAETHPPTSASTPSPSLDADGNLVLFGPRRESTRLQADDGGSSR